MFALSRIRNCVAGVLTYRSFAGNSAKRKKFPYFKLAAGAGLGGTFLFDYVGNDLTYTQASLRFLRSFKVAALISKDYFLALRQKDLSEDSLNEVHLKSANRLLEACLLNGGLYIKVGQGVAAINHMLPVEYTSTLSQLQDECIPSSQEDVDHIFKEEFGCLPGEMYQEFDYKPVAAASLAQVFKAKLKTGENVAVKIQYSGLEQRFPSDLGTIIFLQSLVELAFKNYNFSWILQDLKANLIQEMDFINEAKNSEICAKNLKKFKFVRVPSVYWDLTKKRVLTMEWVDGFKITDMESIKNNRLNVKDIDLKLFKVFSDQIFNTGFVHADPHPGNIFVCKNKSGKAELVILDHGLYEKLSRDIREPLCEFWEATVLRDEPKMKESAAKLKIENYKNFAEVLFQVPFNVDGKVKTKLTDKDIEYMKEVGRKNFKLIMQTLQEMPRNMLFVIRNLNTIRSISREHGDVVDRPKVMARYAQRCLQSRYNSFFGFFVWMYRRFKFEYYLAKQSFKLSIISLYLDVLYTLGRSSATAESILDFTEN